MKVIQTNHANLAFFNDNFYHTRKNFSDAQKLSGEQCLRALGVFGPLPFTPRGFPRDVRQIFRTSARQQGGPKSFVVDFFTYLGFYLTTIKYAKKYCSNHFKCTLPCKIFTLKKKEKAITGLNGCKTFKHTFENS